jgi:hypothetical protein
VSLLLPPPPLSEYNQFFLSLLIWCGRGATVYVLCVYRKVQGLVVRSAHLGCAQADEVCFIYLDARMQTSFFLCVLCGVSAFDMVVGLL